MQGVAYFNGEAELIIPRFANFEYEELVVAFTYLETPPSQGVTALVSNSDCCTSTPTMAVVKSYRNVHFLAKCNGGLVTTFQLPLHVRSNVLAKTIKITSNRWTRFFLLKRFCKFKTSLFFFIAWKLEQSILYSRHAEARRTREWSWNVKMGYR